MKDFLGRYIDSDYTGEQLYRWLKKYIEVVFWNRDKDNYLRLAEENKTEIKMILKNLYKIKQGFRVEEEERGKDEEVEEENNKRRGDSRKEHPLPYLYVPIPTDVFGEMLVFKGYRHIKLKTGYAREFVNAMNFLVKIKVFYKRVYRRAMGTMNLYRE